MSEVEIATLWQIGKAGNAGQEFPKDGGFIAEFTYRVGSDADSINQPNIPPVLVKAGRKQKPKRAGKLLYSTQKLNISFKLDRNYSDGQLIFYYDFLGSETDSIFVNGEKLTEIIGQGELKQNQIPLPALNQGEHIISITTKGGGDGVHWIDYLKLESHIEQGAEEPTASVAEGKSSGNSEGQENTITSNEKGMSTQQSIATSIKTHVPSHGARTSSGTGLEDYAYWLEEIAKEQAAKAGQEKKAFRRGRIWA